MSQFPDYTYKPASPLWVNPLGQPTQTWVAPPTPQEICPPDPITLAEFKAWLRGFCDEREALDAPQIQKVLSELDRVGTVTDDVVPSFDSGPLDGRSVVRKPEESEGAG